MARKTQAQHVNVVLLSRFINRLRLAHGNPVTPADMIEALWWDRDDGGPLCAERYIHMLACVLRTKDFPIQTNWGRGYSYGPVVTRDFTLSERSSVADAVIGRQLVMA